MVRRAQRKENDWRNGAIVVALALMLFALSVDTPGSLARSTYHMLGSAAVGMSVGVAPNPDNTLAAQFAQKEQEIQARESVVDARAGGSLTGTRMLAAASFFLSLLVLILVAANFAMDWRRGRTIA